MTHKKCLLVLILMLFAPAIAFAANVGELLKKAEVADKHVSYRGMKVASFCFAGEQTSARFKVVHLVPDQTRTEYYSPDVLSGMIVIQDGPRFWKYCPKRDMWEESACRMTLSLDSIHEEALQNYDLRLVGMDNVAGRTTYVIHAVPRSRLDSARRVWVDKDCYLVMRSQVESPQGAVVNSSNFTTIEINPSDISRSAFEVKGKIRPARKSEDPRFGIVKPTYLPKGYSLVGVSSLSVNGCCSAHLQFCNGANIISMFQRRAQKDSPITPVRSKVTNVLTWARSGMHFTLMGDVPVSELRKIANSTP
ncbi:MAG: sigma-E factor regulatory protein RseB domain-containing protein [Armatimonadota bacterium]